MKKAFIKIFPALTIITLLIIAFMPFVTNAQNPVTAPIVAILDKGTTSFVNGILANIGNAVLTFTGWLLSVVGVFLNMSINISLGIGRYVDGIPAIKEIWVVIRNLSSIFIIFLLMYSSIATILGAGTTKLKTLVMNVVIAGLLINFSLFFCRVLIDASNLVSLQFYRALAPNSESNANVFDAFYNGGISDVFMSSLKIPQIYQNTKGLQSADAGLSIFIATIGGVIMMVTAGFSFFAASIAFIVRTGILLFIMALSPLYFAGIIFPEIKKEVSDKLWDMFKSQLLFMPAYLFLMYIALRLISSPGFKAIFNHTATGVIPANEGPLGATSIGVIIQYTIAIIFINAPLVAALKFGAVGAKWAPQADGISKWMGGFAGQHTLGRGAKAVAGKFNASGLAARNPNAAVLLNKGLGKAAGATYGGTKGGYDKRFKDYVKERADYGKKLKTPEAVKNRITESEIKKYDVQTGMLKYDADAIETEREAALAAATRSAADPEKQKQFFAQAEQYEKELQKKNAEIESREKGRAAAIEKIKKDAGNTNALTFAKNLEKKGSIWTGARAIGAPTSKANKEAADAIRKELNKGKDAKLLDAIKEAYEGDKPKEDKKPEGGDKPK